MALFGLQHNIVRLVTPLSFRARSGHLQIVDTSGISSSAAIISPDFSPMPLSSVSLLGKRKKRDGRPSLPTEKVAGSPETSVTHGQVTSRAMERKTEEGALHESRRGECPLLLPSSFTLEVLRDAPIHRVHSLLSNRQHISLGRHTMQARFDQFVEKMSKLEPGLSRSLFLRPDLAPSMPIAPGESGLLLAAGSLIGQNGPCSVFRWDEDGPKWVYLGEYVFHLAGALAEEQVSGQSERVRPPVFVA